MFIFNYRGDGKSEVNQMKREFV